MSNAQYMERAARHMLANYRPAPNGLTNANNENDHVVTDLRGNVRYQLPVTIPVFLKTGFNW